ncbi:MAG TPA: sigma-70 family RNA polymerase sigma factor [Polyangiaceae bacterium]|nr:sigma-70 family RNA polymerase sigma factor [Polyangiaceae bacterium]
MPMLRNTPQLLFDFRAGMPAALETVYRHYVRAVDSYLRALARSAGSPELSQPSAVADMLQEVFIRAFSPNARQAYDGLRDFGPYLNTIARNCFIDALRRGKKERSLGLHDSAVALEDLPISTQDQYEPVIIAVLDSYLSELPAPLRGVYEQRFELGVSQQAACGKLGISRRSLRTAEERLRNGLRRALLLAGVWQREMSLGARTLQATRS